MAWQLRADFEEMEGVHRAVEKLKAAGMAEYEVYSPVPHHEEMEEHMPRRGSWVRHFTIVGGISGVLLGLAMCVLSSLLYKLVTGGKPPVNVVPFVVVGFECTILFACLATVVGLVYHARLLPLAPSDPYDPQFSSDRFAVFVGGEPARKQQAMKILQSAGAMQVTECEGGGNADCGLPNSGTGEHMETRKAEGGLPNAE